MGGAGRGSSFKGPLCYDSALLVLPENPIIGPQTRLEPCQLLAPLCPCPACQSWPSCWGEVAAGDIMGLASPFSHQLPSCPVTASQGGCEGEWQPETVGGRGQRGPALCGLDVSRLWLPRASHLGPAPAPLCSRSPLLGPRMVSKFFTPNRNCFPGTTSGARSALVSFRVWGSLPPALTHPPCVHWSAASPSRPRPPPLLLETSGAPRALLRPAGSGL